MKGDTTFNTSGMYGTKGVPNAANYPPARYSPTRWKDADVNFWIYGGYGPDEFLGDMWKYDVSTNMWTWIFGTQSTNQTAVYGTKGVPSPSNFPGCRGWACASWVDLNGDFWLFAGKGYGSDPTKDRQLADIWRYNISTNEWTWMNGDPDEFVHYGVKQQSDEDNTPGMRMEVTANWTDDDGGLWFYGGLSNGVLHTDRNDMWRYDINSNEWTWMSGDTIINVPPNLGTQYIFSPNNTPGARMSHCSWNDADGKFWFFGGKNNSIDEEWSDLWQYDPDINQWAWMGGSIDNNAGNAGDMCDTSSEFYPRGRWENRARWVDGCGNLWLFGGQKNSSGLNDLWIYSTSKNTWSFVSGTLEVGDEGHYGTKGVSNPVNLPPARMGSGSWMDNSGNLWLYAGSHTISPQNLYSDLWRYVPDPDCPAALYCSGLTVSISATGPTTFCKGGDVTLVATANENVTYQWKKNGVNILGATNDSYMATESGNYSVTITANGNDASSNTISVTVNKKPKATVTPSGTVEICEGQTVLLTANQGNNLSYQWKKNGNNIPGATLSTYLASSEGKYKVRVTNVNNGCFNTSNTTTVKITCRNPGESENKLEEVSVYPNPSDGRFTIELSGINQPGNTSARIMNGLGEEVFFLPGMISSGTWREEIDASHLPAGIYFIEIKTLSSFQTSKITLVK